MYVLGVGIDVSGFDSQYWITQMSIVNIIIQMLGSSQGLSCLNILPVLRKGRGCARLRDFPETNKGNVQCFEVAIRNPSK